MVLDSLPVEHLGPLTATVRRRFPTIEGGPNGTGGTATVTAATLVGPKINATMPEGVAGGDWFTMRADGTVSLDVRVNHRTDDGADIFITYLGYLVDGVLKISLRLETGDERYAWLNSAFTVGIGAQTDGGVSYDIYII